MRIVPPSMAQSAREAFNLTRKAEKEFRLKGHTLSNSSYPEIPTSSGIEDVMSLDERSPFFNPDWRTLIKSASKV